MLNMVVLTGVRHEEVDVAWTSGSVLFRYTEVVVGGVIVVNCGNEVVLVVEWLRVEGLIFTAVMLKSSSGLVPSTGPVSRFTDGMEPILGSMRASGSDFLPD